MADEPTNPTPPADPTPGQSAAPPDHDTSSPETEKPDHMIPKSRFDEVNNKAKAEGERATKLETELKTYREAQAKTEEDRLKKQGEFETLFNDEKVKVTDLTTQLATATESLTALQAVFTAMLDTRKEKLPDHIKPLLENMAPLDAMTYLDKHESEFVDPGTGQPRKQTAPPMHATEGVGGKPGEKVGTLRLRAKL